jgi:very-short-patch-repair endonuclease
MRKLMQLAERQHGAFGWCQAKGFGVTPTELKVLFRRGVIERAHLGVYRLAGSPRTWRQKLMIAVLAAGSGAAVSGRAAAALWRIPGYAEGRVEVTQTRRPSRRYPYGHEHSTTYLPEHQIKDVDGIPVTCIERTVLDLCGRQFYERSERLVKTVVGRGRTSLKALGVMLADTAKQGRPGVTRLREVLGNLSEDNPPTESELEDLVEAVLRGAGLDLPVRQAEVGGTTAPIGRIDFLYRLAAIVIEADSKAWHGDWLATEADHRRDALLTAAGFHVIRTNWRQLLEDPDLFVAAVRGALRRAA